MSVHVSALCADVCKEQKRESDVLELELQAVLSWPTGGPLGSSGRIGLLMNQSLLLLRDNSF